MWIVSTYGFYSVVRKEDGYHIRARVKSDLEALLKALPDNPEAFNILETPEADYACRIITDGQGFARLFAVLEQSVVYDDFKSTIGKQPGQKQRKKIYAEVYSLLYELQTPG